MVLELWADLDHWVKVHKSSATSQVEPQAVGVKINLLKNHLIMINSHIINKIGKKLEMI